jgi:hypothetical protein
MVARRDLMMGGVALALLGCAGTEPRGERGAMYGLIGKITANRGSAPP